MKHNHCQYPEGRRRRTVMSLALTFLFFFIVALAAISSPGAVSVNAANVVDPIRGKALFEKRCGGCHSLDAEKEGPRLRNVFGRRSGTIPTFKYSDALKTTHITWDENLLDKWLTNTESVIPDNDMDFQVPKADERADIIEYLRMTAAGK